MCRFLTSVLNTLPVSPAYDGFVNKTDTDRLHPNTAGHRRMALAIQGYLESILPW